MTSEFHRFPSTPHLAWLGSGPLRGDKLLTDAEARDFLSGEVVVEEKIDGANLGISLDDAGGPRFQNRGSWLTPPFAGQWKHLPRWASPLLPQLRQHLGPGLVLFGEWCYATHSVPYCALPDWFVGFDVYEAEAGRFWSVDRRDALLGRLSLPSVPSIHRGPVAMDELLGWVSRPSAYADVPREGIYLRKEGRDGYLEKRCKLVNPDFTQTIDVHWSRRDLCPNRLA